MHEIWDQSHSGEAPILVAEREYPFKRREWLAGEMAYCVGRFLDLCDGRGAKGKMKNKINMEHVKNPGDFLHLGRISESRPFVQPKARSLPTSQTTRKGNSRVS